MVDCSQSPIFLWDLRDLYASIELPPYWFVRVSATWGEQGWRSGESTRLPPMWPGFDSRTRRHMWVEFVTGSRPCSEGFSPGTPVFLPPQKLTFLNSNRSGTHGHV